MNGIKYRQPEEMKDSGVEWQGFTGLEWKKTKLKYIASVRNGATPSTSDPDYWDGNIYWFTPTDFGNQSLYESARTITERGLNSCGTNLVPKGSVIITCRAPIGGLGIIKCEEAAYNQGCKGVVPTNVISQYLYYLLLSAANFIQSRGKGTTFMELSSYDLNNLVVEVPNKKSQRKIANFLDLKTVQFDSIISKKELLIQKLEEAKKSLISEVVTGKVKIVDGEMIPREFDEIRDCGIKGWGMVPDVWQETKVKYELTNYDHLRIPLSSEVRGSMIEKQYDYYGASGVIDKVDSFLFDGKYVLVGEDGANLYSRSTALAYIAEGQFWVNNHAHILKAKNYNDDYYCFILENLDYTVYITGAAQPKLTQDRLANIVLYVAGYHEQCLIQDSLRSKLSKIVNCIEMYSRQIDLLKQAKQSLISEAVTGKIDLRNWEITEEGELQ